MDTKNELETVATPVATPVAAPTASEQSKEVAVERMRTKLRAGKLSRVIDCW